MADGTRGVSDRYYALDGVRGVAALSVMAGHYGQTLGIYWPRHMFLAVDTFFMMSGFVIAHTYSERLSHDMSTRSYLYRRVVRLYPMFVIGLILGAAVLYYGAHNGVIDYSADDILHGVALNAVYLPYLNSADIEGNVGQIFPADPPAWSLFLEMLASGAFLLLFDLRRKALIRISVLCYLALTGAAVYFAQKGDGGWVSVTVGFDTSNYLGGLPRVAFGFTCGVLLHELMRDGVGARRVAATLGRAPYPSFLLYAALLAMFLFPKTIHGLYAMIALATAVPTIVFVGAQIRTGSGIETNAARFLGWISYPIYCLHIPVVRLVIFARGGSRSPADGVMVLSAIITIALAVALTRWYEEPMRAALSGRTSPRRREPVGAPD
jgi:peptidoglycan/LPS O-acetylase OafA/YrhL